MDLINFDKTITRNHFKYQYSIFSNNDVEILLNIKFFYFKEKYSIPHEKEEKKSVCSFVISHFLRIKRKYNKFFKKYI